MHNPETTLARKRTAHLDHSSFLPKLDKGKSLIEFSDGRVIYSQQDPANSVFYVCRGRVKLAAVSPDGKEAVISILGAGAFFGESSLIVGHPVQLATATSIGHTIVARFAAQEMTRLLRTDTKFAALFVSYLVAHIARVEADLVDQICNSAEKRLARILLLLGHFGKEDQSRSTIPKISQATLAQMVGASRARVSTFLNRFRKQGFIDYDGGPLRVHSSLLNVLAHNQQ